jgi:hypothetical protein
MGSFVLKLIAVGEQGKNHEFELDLNESTQGFSLRLSF